MRTGLVAFALVASITAAQSAVLHVRTSGNDANSGLDWAQAKATVGAAIAVANAGDEIWVAAGVYPERIRNRLSAGLSIDVALYGGFDGTETKRDARLRPERVDSRWRGAGRGRDHRLTRGAGHAAADEPARNRQHDNR